MKKINYCFCKQISKNKFLEFQITWFGHIIGFDFSIVHSFKEDHARMIEISLDICGLFISFNISDNRHWNYKNNCWEE